MTGFIVKVGQSSRSITLTLTREDTGGLIDLTGATLTLRVDHETLGVLGPFALTVSGLGVLTYAWATGDVLAAGEARGLITGTLANSRTFKAPDEGYIPLRFEAIF